MTKLTFLNIDELELPDLFREVGMADYNYIITNQYLQEIELYRAALLDKIGALKNGDD